LIDKKNYVLGGTGYLQQNEIGFGYQDQGVVVNVPKKAKDLCILMHLRSA
jgi:hypothetical protein